MQMICLEIDGSGFLGPLHWDGVKGDTLLSSTTKVAGYRKERKMSNQDTGILILTPPLTCFMTLDKSRHHNLCSFSPIKSCG